MKKLALLGASALFFCASASLAPSTPVFAAGIPVIDAAAIAQILTQYQKQIEQYSLQLQQYQNMLQNTKTAESFDWDDAQKSINGLAGILDNMSQYDLKTFGNYNDYDQCFSGTCSASEQAKLQAARQQGSLAQKEANDALYFASQQSRDEMQAEANRLRAVQIRAQDANGQMEALSYANQIASSQANQLLKIQALLVAQTQANAVKMEADAARQAEMDAAGKKVMTDSIQRVPAMDWSDELQKQ